MIKNKKINKIDKNSEQFDVSMILKKFKSSYSFLFELIHETRFLILLSFLILLFSGIITFNFDPKLDLISIAIDNISDYAETLSGKSFFQVSSFIFLNNAKVSLIILSMSFIPFFALFIALTNGAIIGKVLRMNIDISNDYSVLLLLLPHGIFEISAICLSMGFSIKYGLNILGLWKKRDNKPSSIYDFFTVIKEISMLFFMIIVPLLIVAAIIETFLFLIF